MAIHFYTLSHIPYHIIIVEKIALNYFPCLIADWSVCQFDIIIAGLGVGGREGRQLRSWDEIFVNSLFSLTVHVFCSLSFSWLVF